MPIFGDKSTFALSCRVPDETSTNPQILIWCHFLISGDFIGNENESDIPGICEVDLEGSRDKIQALQNTGSESVFSGLSDIEALELILKANQLENEFKPAFVHLPRLADSFWHDHMLQLAETTDQVYVAIVNQKGMLKVITQQPCINKSRQIKSVLCDFNAVLKDFSSCLQFLKIHLSGSPGLK